MAQVNPLTREVLVKLVYYGPGLGGKTTSLQHIHSASPPETRGQLVSLATPVDRTLYFDFLPLRIPPVRDHQVRLQLFTVPGQVYFNATRKLVLTGADGVVFVADSQRVRHDANIESLQNLAQNLEEQGRSLGSIPLVFQYNKRDLPDVNDIEELDRSLNALGAPAVPSSATTGGGVLEALDQLVRAVMDDLEARQAFGEPPSRPQEIRFSQPEDALEEQIGRASEAIWRETIERARETRRTAVVAAVKSSRPPPPPSVVPASPGRVGPSFAGLIPEIGPDLSRLEEILAEGRNAEAVEMCERIARRLLSDVALEAGLIGDDGSPARTAEWLGVPPARWLELRRATRRAGEGAEIDAHTALACFVLLLDIAVRRGR